MSRFKGNKKARFAAITKKVKEVVKVEEVVDVKEVVKVNDTKHTIKKDLRSLEELEAALLAATDKKEIMSLKGKISRRRDNIKVKTGEATTKLRVEIVKLRLEVLKDTAWLEKYEDTKKELATAKAKLETVKGNKLVVLKHNVSGLSRRVKYMEGKLNTVNARIDAHLVTIAKLEWSVRLAENAKRAEKKREGKVKEEVDVFPIVVVGGNNLPSSNEVSESGENGVEGVRGEETNSNRIL